MRRGKEKDKLFHVGCTTPCGISKEKINFEDYEEVCDFDSRFRAYKMPSSTSADEFFALRELMSNLRDEKEIAKKYLIMAQDVMFALMGRVKRPAWFDLGLNLSDVEDVIHSFDRSKHPGFPACLLYRTKGEIIDNFLPDLVQAVVARIVIIRTIGKYCTTPEDFYNTFCSDFCCISIKNEPVKREKNGRILNSTSIVTSAVERLLYREFNYVFKKEVYETFSAIAMGFTSDDSKLLKTNLPAEVMESDVPNMDSSVTEFEGLLNEEFAMRKMGGYRSEVEDHTTLLSRNFERAHFRKIFVLSNGELYLQNDEGHQSTGRDQTANFNTLTRARRAYAVNLRLMTTLRDVDPIVIGAGDDCIEGYHPDKLEVYQELGFPLRDVEKVKKNDISFCSHVWPVNGKPYGKRIIKSAFRLLLAKPLKDEEVEAFCREYNSNPEFSSVVETISVHRPEMNLIMNSIIVREEAKGGFKRLDYTLCVKVGTKKKLPKKASKSKNKSQEASRQSMEKFPPATVAGREVGKPRVPRRVMKDHPQHKLLCGITDPFCVHARGAKLPDESSVPTFPWQFKTLVPVSTGAGNAASGLICANNNFGYRTSTLAPTADGAITIAQLTNWTGAGAALTNFAAGRIVSFGVVFHPTLDFSTSKGYVIFGEVPKLVSGTTFLTGSLDYVNTKIVELIPGRQLSWVSRPQGPLSRQFHTFDPSMDDEGFSSLHFEIAGGPANSVVGLLEIVINLEVIPVNNNAVLSKLATPAAPHVPKVLAAQNKVMTSVGSFIEGGMEAVGARISQFAGEALTFAAEAFLAL